MKKENQDYKKDIKFTKTRRAFDWVLSCLIRLPVFIIFLAMSVFSVGFIMFIISPENVLNALRSIGIML